MIVLPCDSQAAPLSMPSQSDRTKGSLAPIIAAQDYQLSNLNVATEAVVEGSHASTRAAFDNSGTRTEVVYDLVWEDDRWKVDNIRGEGWDLRQIATAPTADAVAP